MDANQSSEVPNQRHQRVDGTETQPCNRRRCSPTRQVDNVPILTRDLPFSRRFCEAGNHTTPAPRRRSRVVCVGIDPWPARRRTVHIELVRGWNAARATTPLLRGKQGSYPRHISLDQHCLTAARLRPLLWIDKLMDMELWTQRCPLSKLMDMDTALQLVTL
jgi:hypothetical protein